MWIVARYLPVAPFSLKPAAATSSGGKTLLIPTPYAIKMALLDVAIRTSGIEEGERLFPFLRDLAVSEEVESMLLLDLDGERAGAAASAHGGGKSTSRAVDARNVDELQNVLEDEDADVLVNTASYRINLDAMSACLKSGSNYLDLGGLYWHLVDLIWIFLFPLLYLV